MTTQKQKNQNRKIIKDNDFDLIQAINSGQTEKFHDLVKRYEQKLYNFSLRMCRNPSDAEDMIQDTFLNVFKYLKNFRYETKFKNWLYKVAASTCIKKRRKSKFAPDKELSLDEFLPNDEAEKPEHVPEWALLPLDKLLNEELSSVINKTIISIPKKYRVVIVLRDIEGFSTAETAQILNLSPANVKVRLHRARLYLRDKLKGYFKNDR
ncbi:RNA polymerase sigma factor [Thermodesulfobacteriota bacterium]